MANKVGIMLTSYIIVDIEEIDFVDNDYNALEDEEKLALTREQFEILAEELNWNLNPTIYQKLEQVSETSIHWES